MCRFHLSLSALAMVYVQSSKTDKAEAALKEALEIAKHLPKDQTLDTLGPLTSLAGVYISQGKYALAEPILVNALESRRRSGLLTPELVLVGERAGVNARRVRSLGPAVRRGFA